MVGSIVTFMRSEPYRSIPSRSRSNQDVPAGFVDLQRELLTAQDQRRLAVRAERGGEQRPSLVGHPLRMLDQRQFVDEFPAAGAVLSAVRGPGPALDLTVAVRARRDPGAALPDV